MTYIKHNTTGTIFTDEKLAELFDKYGIEKVETIGGTPWKQGSAVRVFIFNTEKNRKKASA